MRVVVLVLLLCSAAAAGDGYEERIREALAEQDRVVPGETPEDRFNRAYTMLAEAVAEEPDRWEAYWWRGLNRCRMAVEVHSVIQDRISYARAQGGTDQDVAFIERAGRDFLGLCVQDARHDFHVMEANMRALGQFDADKRLFTHAAVHFAGRHFDVGPQGGPGAIRLFRSLLDRGFEPQVCSEYIALSYNELGVLRFTQEDYAEAQRLWDEGLKHAVAPNTVRTILTNKAGGHEMDRAYGKAESVLRQLTELEPERPEHWKNLGLVLGFQSRLREALYCYARARELCRLIPSTEFYGKWHGNAWLRAALIHGNLLESDGDLRLAWRLFAEYRGMFGDDYNFSLWFGEFCANHGQYELAWLYLTRARDLQPHCTVAYQSLLLIAPRTRGTPEEVRTRIREAEEAHDRARARYDPRAETPAVMRICTGMQDLADGGASPSMGTRLDPDPLQGHGADEPPGWLVRAAEQRRPFEPWEPGDPVEQPAADAPPAAPVEPADGAATAATSGGWVYAVALASLAALGALLLLIRRLTLRSS